MQMPAIFRSVSSRVAAQLNLSAEEPTTRAEVRTLTGFLFQPAEQTSPAATSSPKDRRPNPGEPQ